MCDARVIVIVTPQTEESASPRAWKGVKAVTAAAGLGLDVAFLALGGGISGAFPLPSPASFKTKNDTETMHWVGVGEEWTITPGRHPSCSFASGHIGAQRNSHDAATGTAMNLPRVQPNLPSGTARLWWHPSPPAGASPAPAVQ